MAYHPLLSVLLLLFFPIYATSGWVNFANNLGTVLAPLLALFGEQVTKQFMSESMSSLDSFLCCLAPVGVITAMISSIHVAGSPGLRALVGRAKKSRGEVEADLMSPTSTDMCELWNGDGVVRVLGRPVLLQMIRVKEVGGTWGIYTFNDAIDKRLYTEKGTQIGNPIDERKQNNPPNLSINISMLALPRWMTVLFIGIGMLVQGGVLVFTMGGVQ